MNTQWVPVTDAFMRSFFKCCTFPRSDMLEVVVPRFWAHLREHHPAADPGLDSFVFGRRGWRSTPAAECSCQST